MENDRRVLVIAVASGRVGHVFLDHREVVGHGMSRKASTGTSEAGAHAAKLIENFRPDIVVTEKVLANSKKGDTTIEVIEAITSVAEMADVTDLNVVRSHSFDNRFNEARDLAERYPEMRPYLPRTRKPWEAEPKALIYFEALSLFESALGRKK